MPRPMRILVGAAASFLLISMGGQVIAAPVTVPLLWWAARSTSTRWARGIYIAIASLTMLIVGWAVAYVVGGERQPFIVLYPTLATLTTIIVFVTTTEPRHVA